MEKLRKIYIFSWIKIDLTPWIIDMYIQTIKLWYIFLINWKKQIISKFKRQVIRIWNIRRKDMQEQIKPMFDSYGDNIEDVIDSNIDNDVSGRNNLLRLSKPSAIALQLRRDVLLLFWPFGNGTKATNSKNNNSNILSLCNLSPKLSSSIVSNDLSNLLLKYKDCRLWKIKQSAILVFEGLCDSSYNAG